MRRWTPGMTWKNTEMRALNCAIASLRRHRSLQMRPLHNSQDIGQQSGQGDRLLKGIAKERQKGYQNMSGKKTTFGKFLIEELHGLTGFARGHHRRTLSELIQEGELYEAMNSSQREGHLRRVEYALGSLQWEAEQVRSVPLRIRTGPVLRMQQPSAGSQAIAAPLPPHLRAQWTPPGAEDAEDADFSKQQAGYVPGSHRALLNGQQTMAPWLSDGAGQADADAATVPLPQNGKVALHEGVDGASMAGASEAAAVVSIEQTASTSGPYVPGRQLTYKGIVFDLETTGFPSKKSRILEIAALEMDSQKGMQTLVNIFPHTVPNSEIHGITTEMVHDPSLPTSREAVQQFMDFIDSHCASEDTVPVLIAHNGRRFDIPFLAMEFAREGFKIPANWHFMDTLMVAQKVIDRDNIQSLKLTDMREHFGISAPSVEHRAWQDVEHWRFKAIALFYRDLEKSGFESLGDLLYFFPRSYINFGTVLRDDAYVHLDGTVMQSSAKFFKNLFFSDLTASVEAAAVLPITGRWELDASTVEFLEPTAKKAAAAEGLVPVYSQRAPLKKGDMPKLVSKALTILETAGAVNDMDILPEPVREEHSLMPWLQAMRSRHQPQSEQEAEAARQRLAFEELLVLQLRLLLQRNDIQASALGTEGVCVTEVGLVEAAREALPFQLTGGQERALDNVLRDMQGPLPMMCLLQGDVGCGKTAVAFLALLAAAGSGYQAAIMLPTEILASQTHIKLQQLLQSMPEGLQPKLEFLTGSTKAKERREIIGGLADGSVDLIVGTHALISDSVEFQNLGFAVVDEQHRFGVEQRARLAAKASPAPHVMYMTATPIPRTLALVEHGDLALVTINELPPGRSPVATRALTDSPASRALVYEAIKEELASGGRAYIICPLVGESTTKALADVKAAEEEHRRLVEGGVLGEGVSYGLLHGRLSAEEKADALAAFAAGRTTVLIATTVVEVGVDVPEASVIVVEGAERFGLAALHQLRGRVGRGVRASRCFLITQEPSQRLAILETSHSGFSIAEADLVHRGPGDFLGKRQSGRDAFSLLRSARLPADKDLLDDARRCAAKLISEWQEGAVEPPAALMAAVRRQASMLLDVNHVPASLAPESCGS
ncbi:P-loop containing nucleoside triphosphate hydrolase protein [Coccomyxa subellipsoidea C-169]|uniref:P-loop containing nucleoside triphosphate hydrolase protein n=1 Tax=Coccomyxa subellipsoidea (strain C-169) TaxID=574566 RepID=I0Z769_COCSC|nr:P-loop containing nucleoside triphosphate hydrolase protein [Coccomyxa subellipsoidea C-169]EIE26488.1 P-loop containing nucleoside triphosphate hydrolase protein [Coccomyxa subellipsoidea C-169]|eukprot:XP_005651032.1 P-loop containing nucleoside triphosphate hydrolase protein [Coccomyxa subellipsoidea C-169]